MKRMNFPARKLARQISAARRRGEDVSQLNSAMLHARGIRTKKVRTK
jgi:hypothetical protein